MVFKRKKTTKPAGKKPDSRFIDSDRFPVAEALESAQSIDFGLDVPEELTAPQAPIAIQEPVDTDLSSTEEEFSANQAVIDVEPEEFAEEVKPTKKKKPASKPASKKISLDNIDTPGKEVALGDLKPRKKRDDRTEIMQENIKARKKTISADVSRKPTPGEEIPLGALEPKKKNNKATKPEGIENLKEIEVGSAEESVAENIVEAFETPVIEATTVEQTAEPTAKFTGGVMSQAERAPFLKGKSKNEILDDLPSSEELHAYEASIVQKMRPPIGPHAETQAENFDVPVEAQPIFEMKEIHQEISIEEELEQELDVIEGFHAKPTEKFVEAPEEDLVLDWEDVDKFMQTSVEELLAGDTQPVSSTPPVPVAHQSPRHKIPLTNSSSQLKRIAQPHTAPSKKTVVAMSNTTTTLPSGNMKPIYANSNVSLCPLPDELIIPAEYTSIPVFEVDEEDLMIASEEHPELDLSIVAKTQLSPEFELILVRHENYYALMVDNGTNAQVLKSFDYNPVADSINLNVTEEARVRDNKMMYLVEVGNWQGVIALESDEPKLEVEL